MNTQLQRVGKMTLLPVLGGEEAAQTEYRVSDTKQSIPFSIQKHLKEKYRKIQCIL